MGRIKVQILEANMVHQPLLISELTKMEVGTLIAYQTQDTFQDQAL